MIAEKINKRNKRIILVLMSLFVFAVVLLANVNKGEDLSIVQKNMFVFLNNWTISDGNDVIKATQLPVEIDVSPGTDYQATTVLPDVDSQMNYLLLRSSMQDMTVYLDDVEVHRYEEPQKEALGIKKPVASTWMMFKLPPDFQGKTLKIVIKSDVAIFSGTINQVRLGESAALIEGIFKHALSGFLVFLFLFVIGLVLSLFALFTKSTKDNRFLYLGLLAIATSIWILSEARIMQFFTGNRYIIGSISYLMVPLMGIFFSLYFKETILSNDRYKRWVQVVAVIYLLGLMTTMLLQIEGISPFIESMKITFGVIFLNIMIFLVIIILEIKKQKNQNAKKFLKYLSVLCISILFEGIVFFNGYFDYTSFFLRIGILAFFGLLLLDSYHYVKKGFESQRERDIFEKLAYKDFLTGANNRAAFERDLDNLMNKTERSFILALLDLNELKYINDHYGHGSGDEAIKNLYTIMNEAFINIGRCYRIGGDEFAILIDNTDDDLVNSSVQQVRNQLKREESRHEYPLDVAIGMELYDQKIWSNKTKFYHHVDQKMYEDKMKRKQMRKTKKTIETS
ncbi:GGDEF domain-containing protein [Acetobacterium woodii]|uniref:Diguanylate cyclase n=1 Tax=Acetobacterium woodii (strain ATCC 29683 / DSM 1030 / JCM 2381 / KCTC 1655 / WB1) TaxID=931626 RepID=H6LK78_ACEWD|nr:GGDEF domain-containing protein [Acetobacterium woodii]AFA49998.1 diguanylate cyclase [Acetobacterium woodii DSM 1030]